MNRLDDALRVRATADCVCTEAEVNAAYDRIAAALQEEYAGRNPLVLVIMSGGMVPAAELLKRVEFAFELDYLHATRYRGATSGGGLLWKRQPQVELTGRHVLVIDDILDEGRTLLAVRRALQEQMPASLKVAVLAEKRPAARVAGAEAEFVGLQLPDRYVFGCGMDYKEYWRQLPAIYAVREGS
jgi:hypoxanthine phosphoribosyltransferase